MLATTAWQTAYRNAWKLRRCSRFRFQCANGTLHVHPQEQCSWGTTTLTCDPGGVTHSRELMRVWTGTRSCSTIATQRRCTTTLSCIAFANLRATTPPKLCISRCTHALLLMCCRLQQWHSMESSRNTARGTCTCSTRPAQEFVVCEFVCSGKHGIKRIKQQLGRKSDGVKPNKHAEFS